MTQNKVWNLVVNNQPLALILVPPSSRGTCWKCRLAKEIMVISERTINPSFSEERKFCWGCSLANLYELEQGDYQIVNKKAVLKEIRTALLAPANGYQKNEELLECYD